MKNVTVTRDQVISASNITDDGLKSWVLRAIPELVVISVEDSAVVDVEATPAPAPAPEAPAAPEATPA